MSNGYHCGVLKFKFYQSLNFLFSDYINVSCSLIKDYYLGFLNISKINMVAYSQDSSTDTDQLPLSRAKVRTVLSYLLVNALLIFV